VSPAAWTTVLARKLIGPDGEFLGAIGGPSSRPFAEKVLRIGGARRRRRHLDVHRDGTLLARYPHVDDMIRAEFRIKPVFEQVLSEGRSRDDAHQQSGRWPGAAGLSAGTDQFPIVMIATTTVAAALVDWRERPVLFGVAGLSAFVIAVMRSSSCALSRQHQATQQRLSLKTNVRHRHQQHDPGPASVRFGASGRGLQTGAILRCTACRRTW